MNACFVYEKVVLNAGHADISREGGWQSGNRHTAPGDWYLKTLNVSLENALLRLSTQSPEDLIRSFAQCCGASSIDQFIQLIQLINLIHTVDGDIDMHKTDTCHCPVVHGIWFVFICAVVPVDSVWQR